MEDLDGSRGAPGHLSDELLTAYLDGAPDLTPAARATVEAHLAGCAGCRAALRDLETTVALLRDLPQLAPRRSFALTPELVEAAGGRRRQVRHEPAHAASRRLAWVWPARWASMLATLLFAVVVGLDVSVPAPAPSPTSVTQVVANGAHGALATSTPTLSLPPSVPEEPVLGAFSLTPTVFPTPTPVVAAPPPEPALVVDETDYRVAEVGLGALALLFGAAGFLAPPFLRRRSAAP